MKTTAKLIVALVLSAAPLSLVSCDGKVTAEQASKAGEVLKQWQEQNK